MIRTTDRACRLASTDVGLWRMDRSYSGANRGCEGYGITRRLARRADRRHGRAVCAEAITTAPATPITAFVAGEVIVIG
jgi:hypothetical protein